MRRLTALLITGLFLGLGVHLYSAMKENPLETNVPTPPEPVKVGFAETAIDTCGDLGGLTLHDPLKGSVAWIDDGKAPALMIAIDHVEFPPDDIRVLKEAVRDVVGIPLNRMFVACSHAHASIELDARKLGRKLGETAAAARKAAEPAWVASRAIDVGRAFSVNRRKEIGSGIGAMTFIYNHHQETDLTQGRTDVRRQVVDFLESGVNTMVPSYKDYKRPPDIEQRIPSASRELIRTLPEHIYLDEPIDPILDLLVFKRENGSYLGSVVRFSCHPVIFQMSLFHQYSADFPGVLQREIMQATGAPCLFINGPCGDITPLYKEYGEEEMERIGKGLAKRAIEVLPELTVQPLQKTAFLYREEVFPVEADMIRWNNKDYGKEADEEIRYPETDFHPAVMKDLQDAVLRRWAASYYDIKTDRLSLPFSLLAFNDILLVNFPGEIFSRFSEDVRRAFPGHHILVGSLIDSDIPGYVPTLEDFPLGGYEVAASNLPPGSGERMVEIVIEMIDRVAKP